MNKISVIT